MRNGPSKLYHAQLSGHAAVHLIGMEEVDDQMAMKKVAFWNAELSQSLLMLAPDSLRLRSA